MDRDQFRARLNALGYTCQDFADLSGYSPKTVCDFGARTPVPHIVRSYLTLIEHCHRHQIGLPAEIAHHTAPQVTSERAQKLLQATLRTF